MIFISHHNAIVRVKFPLLNMKVSIGIPAYKPEFLEEAIASVLAQTFEDWELIVVDDCSPGDIKGIVERFIDPRIKYYRNEQNLGAEDPSYNWDKCMSYAQGEYFCLLCDDDLYHPEFLKEMLKLTEQFPYCNVFRARSLRIDGNGNTISKYPASPLWESCEDYIWHKTKGLRFQTISEWMLRRQHVLDCGGYTHSPCAWAADTVSIYRFSLKGGISSSYQILVSTRDSGINISAQAEKFLLPKLDAYVMEKETIGTLIAENGMDSKLISLIDDQKDLQCRSLLSQVSLTSFLKVVLLRRKTYGISCISVAIDLLKRMKRCFTSRR